MRILLTNDDGVHAKGISILREIALSITDDVWTVAPATEQSAASRRVSLHNPVVCRRVEEKIYSVSGTPTDSVIVALSETLKDHKPDLILSGINHGQNIAEDIGFSGTVAGALQGLQMGVPSISMSLARGLNTYGTGKLNWDIPLQYGPDLIKKLLAEGWPKDVALNVNFPDVETGAVNGVHVTSQGKRDFIMSDVDKRKHPRGGHYYWLTYGAGKSNPPKGTDLRAIYDGYISITPIHVDHTHYKTAASLSALFED